MIEALRSIERKILIGVVALSATALAVSESIIWICLVDSIVICIAAVCVILFGKESGGDKDEKTITVAALLIAALLFFALSLLFAQKWLTLVFVIAITWAVGYVIARFMQDKKPELPTGLLAVLLIPGGVLIVESLAGVVMRLRKKSG